MKIIKITLILVAFSLNFMNAQQKGSPTSTSATLKTIGNTKVNYISKSKLLEGTNSVMLSSGKVISITVKAGTISSATIDGVSYKLSNNVPGAGFICTPLQCECHGIEDCNDMFGPNGPCKSCIECAICDDNDNCVCIRAAKKAPKSNKNKDIKATTPSTTTKK